MSTVLARPALVKERVQCAKRSSWAPPPFTPQLMHAIAVAIRKPSAACRDRLRPGNYEVRGAFGIVGTVCVGRDTETAATVTPDANELLALVLSKLNFATRQRILRELPADFSSNGNRMPTVDTELIEEASTLCQSLRYKITQRRRGAVTGDLNIYTIRDLDLDSD